MFVSYFHRYRSTKERVRDREIRDREKGRYYYKNCQADCKIAGK